MPEFADELPPASAGGTLSKEESALAEIHCSGWAKGFWLKPKTFLNANLQLKLEATHAEFLPALMMPKEHLMTSFS